MSCCANKNKEAFTIIESSKPTLLSSVKPYQSLIVMVAVVLIGASALSLSLSLNWMPIFMGLFLLNFAMFKLFDIQGFAKSFSMYDVIGKRSSLYAKAYPFIELILAIGFLSNHYLEIASLITALIMAIGLIGIIQNRRSGTQTRCACMGSLINVPVGSITILENTSMIVMSIMLLTHFI